MDQRKKGKKKGFLRGKTRKSLNALWKLYEEERHSINKAQPLALCPHLSASQIKSLWVHGCLLTPSRIDTSAEQISRRKNGI